MKTSLRIELLQWLLVVAILGSAHWAGRSALVVYVLQETRHAARHPHASAEEVSHRAAPYQANTRETDALFSMIQQQHRELEAVSSALEAARELSWNLAVWGALTSVLVTLLLVAALVLLPKRAAYQP